MFGADAADLLRRKQRKRADTPSPSSRAQFTWHPRTRDHARTWVHRMVECTREHTLPPDVLRQLGVLAAAMPGEHPHGAVARDALEMGGGGGGEHGMSAEQRLRILDDLVEMLNYFDRVPYQQGTYARSPQQIELHYRLTMAVAKRLMGTHFQRVLPRLRARFPDIEDSNAWICVSAPRRFGKTVALSLFTAAVMLTIPGWNVVLFSTMWQISKMISQRITEVISNAGYAERLRRDNKDELFVQPIGHADLTHLKLPSSNEDRYGHARPRARARARADQGNFGGSYGGTLACSNRNMSGALYGRGASEAAESTNDTCVVRIVSRK